MALKNKGKGPTARRVGYARIAVWAVIAIVAAALVVFLQDNGKETEEADKPTKRGKIAEVKPSLSDRAETPEQRAAEPSKAKPEAQQPLPPQRVGELRDGYRLLPSGRLHKVLGTIINRDTSNEYLEKTFPEPADQLIAGVITIEPGEAIVGDAKSFFSNFAEQFQSAMLNPIRIEPEDDEYTRELKEAVKATRDELAARLKAGEDVAQIMIDTRNQYQELGLYRNELTELVRQSLEDGEMSAADYEDLVKAANVMLEERGSKPIDLPETFKRYIDMMGIDAETNDEQEEDSNEQ